MGGGHGPPQSVLLVCTNVHILSCVVAFMYTLYIYLAPLCKYVNIYLKPPMCCKYVYNIYSQRYAVTCPAQRLGTQRSPF